MRLSPAGKPGQFACDRCGKPQFKGVYTGHADYHHLCSLCREELRPRVDTLARAAQPPVPGVSWRFDEEFVVLGRVPGDRVATKPS